MKNYWIVKVEGETLTLPRELSELLRIQSGAYILIEADTRTREAVPGAMAKVDTVLGEHNVNIIYAEGEMIEDEPELYTSVKMLDMRNADITAETLEKTLRTMEEVMEIKFVEF